MMIPTRLLSGYRDFRKDRYAEQAEHYRAVAHGQKPQTMVIACADSRVDPTMIFSAAPGELYVVRNVAALVPPRESQGTYHGTSAALEFGVTQLGVSNIVVLGHAMCGGIAASLEAATHKPVGEFIGPWIEQISGIRDELLERTEPSHREIRQQALERMAIQLSLDNLNTFPFVTERVEKGTLSLHGAWFSIADGALHWLDWDTGVFERVMREPEAAGRATIRPPRAPSFATAQA
ncbi:MAG: carbonic anhydrase [Hyphomicrobiaceae bacterium]